jgi:N-methylhydantoinase B
VVRCLIPEDVPTNGGVARCVEVRAPAGSLVNARPPHAVAAGNVETSQRLADVLFLALARAGARVPAQGQGTMNNVILGTAAWTYYETIGGGQGSSGAGPGPSGVHVGMSNTMNTPVEVLELELPVRVGVPRGIYGLAESVNDPAFATSVGLLRWGQLCAAPIEQPEEQRRFDVGNWWGRLFAWLKDLLPQ